MLSFLRITMKITERYGAIVKAIKPIKKVCTLGKLVFSLMVAIKTSKEENVGGANIIDKIFANNSFIIEFISKLFKHFLL
jgi:hypothetical protein